MKFKRKKDVEEKSKLYFLVSMILVLFISLIFVENKTYYVIEKNKPDKLISSSLKVLEDETFSDFKIESPQPIQKKINTASNQLPEIDRDNLNDSHFEESIEIDFADLFEYSKNQNEALTSSDIDDIPSVEKIAPIAYSNVSKAPVFKGCEMLNTTEEQKKCMNNKIAKIITRRLSSHLVKQDNGVKIYVQFTINENGEVVDVKTNSTSELLNVKAKKIIENLPIFIPAEHNQQKVQVIYSVPIFISVN